MQASTKVRSIGAEASKPEKVAKLSTGKKIGKPASKKATAKPAAKAKKSAATERSPRGPRGFDPSTKLTWLTKENPKRENSASYKRFDAYCKTKTIGEFLAAGGTTGDLHYDSQHEFLKIG